MTLPDSPVTVTYTGRVLRSWHTPTSTGAELMLSTLTHLLVYGPLPPVTRGATLKVTGTLNRNGSLDLQQAERLIPAREIAFTFYTRAPRLGGPAAAAVVSAFGDDTHDTIRTHPGVLRHTKGVSPSAARSLSKFARNKHRLYVAMMQLAVQGLPPEHAWPLLYRHCSVRVSSPSPRNARYDAAYSIPGQGARPGPWQTAHGQHACAGPSSDP